ncbi:hypothetical protein FKW77_008757 [Venturia effusa]|uniref:Uncharacterized protein n=1 Tax=Venturia effusa TaxID=50376 RepID=A0A517LED4_9PEZI|nr:hypothetical protein FKW77_008757 [Venturia effusa]
MPSTIPKTTPWAIEEDVFISLSREAPLGTPSRSDGLRKVTERLNGFLQDNGFTHRRALPEVRKRYTVKELKKLNAWELLDPSVNKRAYNRVQDWISDSTNATMLAIIEGAIVA